MARAPHQLRFDGFVAVLDGALVRCTPANVTARTAPDDVLSRLRPDAFVGPHAPQDPQTVGHWFEQPAGFLGRLGAAFAAEPGGRARVVVYDPQAAAPTDAPTLTPDAFVRHVREAWGDAGWDVRGAGRWGWPLRGRGHRALWSLADMPDGYTGLEAQDIGLAFSLLPKVATANERVLARFAADGVTTEVVRADGGVAFVRASANSSATLDALPASAFTGAHLIVVEHGPEATALAERVWLRTRLPVCVCGAPAGGASDAPFGRGSVALAAASTTTALGVLAPWLRCLVLRVGSVDRPDPADAVASRGVAWGRFEDLFVGRLHGTGQDPPAFPQCLVQPHATPFGWTTLAGEMRQRALVDAPAGSARPWWGPVGEWVACLEACVGALGGTAGAVRAALGSVVLPPGTGMLRTVLGCLALVDATPAAPSGLRPGLCPGCCRFAAQRAGTTEAGRDGLCCRGCGEGRGHDPVDHRPVEIAAEGGRAATVEDAFARAWHAGAAEGLLGCDLPDAVEPERLGRLLADAARRLLG